MSTVTVLLLILNVVLHVHADFHIVNCEEESESTLMYPEAKATYLLPMPSSKHGCPYVLSQTNSDANSYYGLGQNPLYVEDSPFFIQHLCGWDLLQLYPQAGGIIDVYDYSGNGALVAECSQSPNVAPLTCAQPKSHSDDERITQSCVDRYYCSSNLVCA
jgi:hypothetical protein